RYAETRIPELLDLTRFELHTYRHTTVDVDMCSGCIRPYDRCLPQAGHASGRVVGHVDRVVPDAANRSQTDPNGSRNAGGPTDIRRWAPHSAGRGPLGDRGGLEMHLYANPSCEWTVPKTAYLLGLIPRHGGRQRPRETTGCLRSLGVAHASSRDPPRDVDRGTRRSPWPFPRNSGPGSRRPEPRAAVRGRPDTLAKLGLVPGRSSDRADGRG